VPHPDNEAGDNNQFYECIWINNAWETIGTLTADNNINLDNYYTKDEINGFLGGLSDATDDLEELL
jgi:hypothetical protein